MSDIANAVDRLELGIDLVAALDMACSDAPPHMRSPLRALAETAIAELKAARDELVMSMSTAAQPDHQ